MRELLYQHKTAHTVGRTSASELVTLCVIHSEDIRSNRTGSNFSGLTYSRSWVTCRPTRSQSSSGPKQLQSRLLLEFMDQLEKRIAQVTEENMAHLTQNQRNNAIFFRANRKVCEDWFSRMRQALVVASDACRSAPCTIRHSFQVVLLFIWSNVNSEFRTSHTPFLSLSTMPNEGRICTIA